MKQKARLLLQQIEDSVLRDQLSDLPVPLDLAHACASAALSAFISRITTQHAARRLYLLRLYTLLCQQQKAETRKVSEGTS